MVSKKRQVLWDNKAKENLRKAITYIHKESPQGAKILKNKILETVKKLPSNPDIFEADKLKKENDGSYRVFYAYSYRIVYKVTEAAILILRVRHTSREPLEY